MFVHGDDFVSVSEENDLLYDQSVLKSKYEVKSSLVGPFGHHEKQFRIFGRILTCSDDDYDQYDVLLDQTPHANSSLLVLQTVSKG